jgi:uridine kinase
VRRGDLTRSSIPRPGLDAAGAAVAERVLASPATLGAGRLVCVDGPSGSGKTTLAAAVVRHLGGAARVRVLHMDDVYDGWAGLAAGMATVATSVVAPLADGRAGHYRRYDWHRGVFAEEHVVEPCDVLVVEGVGAGQASYAAGTTCLVWVEAPSAVRLARGLARDGDAAREALTAWRALEQEMFARERTRRRADLVVDGLSGAVTG